MSAAPLLQVQGLSVALDGPAGPRPVLQGLDLAIDRGQTLGLIGESGCGKSMAALALIGLLPEGARASGSVRLDGQELLALDERGWCGVRGARIGMVFQEPMTALNPLYSIGEQIVEVLQLKLGLPRPEALARAVQLLADTGIPQPEEKVHAYPHQLSGGQRQRAMIAMALACQPRLLLADEPTSALDPAATQAVCYALSAVAAAPGRTLLTVVHDLELLPLLATRVIGMADGRVRFDRPLGEAAPALLQSLYQRQTAEAAPAAPSDSSPVIRFASA